jgi:hypothetical protein
MDKVFRHCAICGELPGQNHKHFLYESAGGHRFIAAESVKG